MKKKHLIILFLIISSSLLAQENWTVYNISNSDLTFDSVGDIEFDSQGNKWIASGYNGIAKFDDTNWTVYNTNNGQGTTDNYKITFYTGDVGSWVSIGATTIVQLSDGTQTTINSSHNYSTDILSIEIPKNAASFEIEYYIEDSSSVNMIFNNPNSGDIIHQETFTGQMSFNYSYTFFTNIMTNQVIDDIAIDNLDNKWIGTYQKGLMKFDDVNWTNYTVENSDLPNNNIKCVTTDNENNVWIGTYSGLTKFDGSIWTNYNTTNSNIPSNIVESIKLDNNNNIWITSGGVLSQFDGENWMTFENSPVKPYKILSIDSNNIKWMNAGYGFMSFDGNNWEYFNYFESNNSCLLDCYVESLAIDSKSKLWVGTAQECSIGGLLNFLDCTTYLTSNSDLPDNNIKSLNFDSDNNLWVGTHNAGLAKLTFGELSTNEFIASNPEIKIHPNPITKYLNIEIENKLIDAKFSIIETTGKVIKTGLLSRVSNQIELQELSKGIYFIKITKGNYTKTAKIIK